jgi:hypothetical protein
MQARGKLLELAAKNPAIGLLRPNGLDDGPVLRTFASVRASEP